MKTKEKKEIAISLIKKLRSKGYKGYLVGGCVRDKIMNNEDKTQDYDIVTDAKPKDIIKFFPRTIKVGMKFGVIKVLQNKLEYEIATFRKDGNYEDGRRPVSVEFSDEKEDVYRRDLTINGLLYDPISDKVIDYVNGKEDIENKIIRTIGDPFERFSEDYLRMIRAIRFASRFNFSIEERTWQAILEYASNIDKISKERIYDELNKILTNENRAIALKYLYDSQLLKYILPEVFSYLNENPEQNNLLPKLFDELSNKAHFETVFASMYVVIYFDEYYKSPVPKNVINRINKKCRELKFSNTLTKSVIEIFQVSFYIWNIEQLKVWEIKRLLRSPEINKALGLNKILNKIMNLKSNAVNYCEDKLYKYNDSIFVTPLINGQDLIDLGIAQGRLYSEILYDVENQQLEDNLNTKSQAIEYVKNKYM
jgi:poly(A) polymerase